MTTGGAGAGTFYYHYDGLGSVTDVTNTTGTPQIEYAYDPFGDLRKNQTTTAAPDNNLRYTGEYHDDFTDTYHLRARQYDPSVGRFTQTDPAAPAIDDPYVSTYVYASNVPTRYTDPSGCYSLDEALTACAEGIAESIVEALAICALSLGTSCSYGLVDIVLSCVIEVGLSYLTSSGYDELVAILDGYLDVDTAVEVAEGVVAGLEAAGYVF